MKALLLLLVFLIFCWQPPLAARASAANNDACRKSNKLFELGIAQENAATKAKLLKQALTQFQSLNNVTCQAETHEAIGDSYFSQNLMDNAVQQYELALEIWRQRNEPTRQAPMLTMLGYVEIRNGEPLRAISYFTQAQVLVDDDDFAVRAKIAAGLAYIFNDLGLPKNGLAQYRRAMDYYRRSAEDLLREPEDREKDLRSYRRQMMLVGYTYFFLEDYPAAIEHLQRAFNLFEASTHPAREVDAAESNEYLGRVYLATHQYSLALHHWTSVTALYEKRGLQRDAARVRAYMGQTYERLGEVDRARATYLEASRILRELHDRISFSAVRFALGRLEMSQNNYDAAEQYLKESIETTEGIRNDLNSRLFAAAFSANVHERYEAYIDCLLKRHSQFPNQGFAARAFEASELARARSLAEFLRDTQTKVISGANPQLIAQERTLRQAIRDKVEQSITLLAGDSKKKQFDELESSLTRLREQHKQVVQELQKQNIHYEQIKEPATYSLRQVQEEIIEDDQTTLLEYFLGKNASYVWLITRKDIKVFPLKRSDEITSAVRVVYELLKSEPKSDTAKRLTEATAQLAQMVLGPLGNELNGRRVIVVADGALNYIPFQLLPGMSNSQPLVENYEIVNAPSASVLGQLRHEKQQRRPRTRILAAFGDPVFPENYAQFKATGAAVASANGHASRDIEVQGDTVDPSKIQSLFYSKFELNDLSEIAGSSSLIRRGFDASRAVFENTDFSKYAILHIATHAVLDTKVPERSGFYLSMVDTEGQQQPAGFITMQDVYSLQVPVDLVVLSACRTGLGKEVSGEGLIGLTRGFMHAGASSVVSSLWKVDDEATATLMKHFYVNMLQKGMRPAEALRAAQNTLRQNPQWQAPHFWAGFTLQGEFKEPLRLPQPSGASRAVQNGVGIGLLFTLLAGIAWGFYRRRSVSIS